MGSVAKRTLAGLTAPTKRYELAFGQREGVSFGVNELEGTPDSEGTVGSDLDDYVGHGEDGSSGEASGCRVVAEVYGDGQV